MVIHGSTWQYRTIHGNTWEYMNYRFFRGIYVGMTVNVLEYMVIHDNTSQYMAIHELMNSRFFRGICVGMTVHVLEYMQYMVIHAIRGSLVFSGIHFVSVFTHPSNYW
jgi:hypothetical protein